MRSVAVVSGAVLVGAAVVVGSALAATTPRVKHTSAGTKLAQASLITKADLGQGWSADAQTGAARGVRLSCNGFQPKQNDVVEVGAAATPSFSGGQVGPYLVQKTSVYASGAHVNKLWNRAVKSGLANCVASDLQTLTARGLAVSITSKRMLPFPKVAPRAALYRVIATVTSGSQRLTVYFDVVLLAGKRTVSQIAISQFQTAPPAKLEQLLGKLVARRMGVTPSA